MSPPVTVAPETLAPFIERLGAELDRGLPPQPSRGLHTERPYVSLPPGAQGAGEPDERPQLWA